VIILIAAGSLVGTVLKEMLILGQAAGGIEALAKDVLYQGLNTIMLIFINGPLRLFLEIKEGKTSVKKLVEEFEDERNVVHQRFGLKKPDLLPT
jgi:uncharacterized membrane protein YqgA involved in biofilm formation